MITTSVAQISEQSNPPTQYRLENINISILHQTSRRIKGGYKINISGTGKVSYILDKKDKTQFNLNKETVVELLNEFYRIHFFELQDTYTLKKEVVLLDGNSISLSIQRLVDISSTLLCIKISAYKKCVRIVGNQPLEANLLVEKIESIVSKAITGKHNF